MTKDREKKKMKIVWNSNIRSNPTASRIPEKENENRAEKVFEEITGEIFPILAKTIISRN